MTPNTTKIIVTGDICIDWLHYPTKPKDQGLNWELHSGTRMIAKPGGALLLADILDNSTDASVVSPQLENIENIPPEEVLHSNAELDLFPYSSDPKDKNKLIYRINRFFGFTGPTNGLPGLLSVEDDDPDADIVILDDAGNGFRSQEKYWPLALLEDGKKPVVIYKMFRPLAAGDLWEKVQNDHSEKLVVVISAEDLRAGGVNISRCLSWEKTAKDFVWQMASNPDLLPLVYCSNLVVRFGLEGAIYYMYKGNRVESCLYFDPVTIEDSFKEKYPGEMQGLSSVFTAALAARIAGSNAAGDISEAVGEGIRDGIQASRRLLRHGYGNNVDHPSLKILKPQENEHDNIADIIIPNPTGSQLDDPNFWCILKEIKGTMLEDIAYDIVRNGETAALKNVPVGNFGKLKTVDRAEIESFQSIKNLIHEYVNSQRSVRPLSIAVFGPPGSGKSFAVTEVAKSIALGRVVRLEFNVSQFRSQSDLTNAFHRVRDCALKGIIPLVFFDEFDSPFEDKLGWLKYFLSPMQDGTFRDNESVHPIGRSIFVFAGGTNNTFQKFSTDDSTSEFKNAKGPDFISRLRGYVNILGPNPADPDDTVFVIRRAMLLRSLLERTAKQLIDNKNSALIDEGVLRAIIEMSMLTDRIFWDQSCLPARQQLMLHVDEEIFSNLVSRDVLLGAGQPVKSWRWPYMKITWRTRKVKNPL